MKLTKTKLLSCLKNTHANVIKPLEVFKSEDISEDTTFAFVSVSVENVKQTLLDNDLAVSS